MLQVSRKLTFWLKVCLITLMASLISKAIADSAYSSDQGVISKQDYLEPARLNLPLKWRSQVGLTTFRSTISFANDKIIVGSNGKSRSLMNDSRDGVYLLDARTGQLERQIKNPGEGDTDVNGVAIHHDTLFFNTDSDRLYSYSFTGQQNWRFVANSDLEGAPSLTDVTGDGFPDVIIASESGTVYAVNGKNGEQIWQFQNQMESVPGKYEYLSSQSFMSSPALVDLNNDQVRDVLIGGRNAIFYALDGKTGSLIWRYHTTSGIHSSAIATNMDGELQIIIAEAYSDVSILDFQGNLQTSYQLSAPLGGIQGLFSSPVYTPQGNIAIGSSWWESKDDGLWLMPLHQKNNSLDKAIFLGEQRISATPLVADILGQPTSQVIAVTENKKLLVSSETGDLIATMDLRAPVEATPLIADIDGDGQNEILIAATDGYLYCYGTKGGGKVHWGQFRGNNYNTGTF